MTSDIELVSTALAEFDKVAAGLAILDKNYKGVLYDVETPEGMNHAKAARVALRTPRYEIERIRKSAKAPLLSIGKRLDGEAARITAEILKLEDPIHDQIKSEEDRIEREKQARIDAENERVADIHARINAMRNTVATSASLPADKLNAVIADIQASEIDDSFEEFKDQAQDAKIAAIHSLEQLRDAAMAREAEAARVKAEREELARLRAADEQRAREVRVAQDEINRVERARIAEEQRVASEKQAVLAAQQREELRRQQEEFNRQAAEQHAREAQAAAELQAQRAALEQEQTALRASQAAKEVPLPAVKRGEIPSSSQVIRIIADHFGVTQRLANEWLQELFG